MSSVHFCGELARLYPDAAALVHSFATSASPPAQSQCPPFTKELNLDPVYLKSVDGFGKLRELIQNWHDECLASASPTVLQPVEYHGANWVVIALCVRTGPRDGIVVGYFAQWRASGVGMCAQLTNFGTVLAPSILALGRSEKRASNSAGCFGEGMKVELNRLVAGGAHVRILTGGCLWEFGYATVAESSCLVCRGQPYPLESAGHTSVVVDQLQVQADLARDYLFLRPPLPGTVASGAPVRFLLGEELAGKVFVRGILIKDYGTSRLPRLGLDFIGDKSLYSTIRLGRDRNDVDLRVIAGFVPTAFVNVADAGAKIEVAARIYDSVLECPTGDMSHIFETWCQPSQTTHGDDEVVADALVDAFRHRHPQGFPVERVADSRGESEMREAAYLLATPVPLPAELYRLLQRSPHMPTLDALWKQHEAAVLALPDWVPANQLQRETAERFVTVALEWFAPHLMLHQLRFKCFPAGTERAVVGAGGADGAVHYCVNIDQLQTAPVHVWQLRETGVRCINLERDPATGGLACGGACVLNRYQDALLTELKRRLGHTQARHLERNMRAAMLRRESRALPNVDLPPRADDTPGDEAGASRFHTSSPPPLGKSPHAAEPPRDPSAMSAKQLKQGLRDLGLDVVGLGPERADLEAAFREVASARAGPPPASGGSAPRQTTARGMRATAHDLVCRCMRKRSAHGEPDSIHHAPRRSGPVFESCVETAESALNLRYTRDAQTVDAYIQLRVFTDPSAPLEPHPDSEARLGSLLVRIAQQVFKWTATDIGGKLRIFQRDDERIAFNRDGLLFFNAHYYRTLHMGTAAAAGPKTGADAAAAGDAECFWFVTFAHELAHNVSPGHDLAHEQALEALTTAYLPAFADELSQGRLALPAEPTRLFGGKLNPIRIS